VKPQSADVYRLLRLHPEGITAQDAIREVACYRLAARIADLRADGITVQAELVGSNGHRYARYRLHEEPAEQLRIAL
jgi:hypothetical protein